MSVVSSSMASVAGASVVSVVVDIDLVPSSTIDDFGRSAVSILSC